jgi:hypothetical protein
VLGRILYHVGAAEPDAMIDLLRAEGFVAGDVAPDEVLRYIGGLADPLRVERLDFDRAWIARQGERMVNLRSRAYWETGRALTVPAQYLLVVRVLSGWMKILAQLDCSVAVQGLAQRWLPGFPVDGARPDCASAPSPTADQTEPNAPAIGCSNLGGASC